MRTVVVSAVNIVEGGTLTVLQNCLAGAAEVLPPSWRIVALVNNVGLVTDPRIEAIAFPDAKPSWLRRLRYEWFGFREVSTRLSCDLWLALHDITPRVVARRQVVYCHNPAPFYKASWRESRLDPSFWMFNKFYRYLYAAFIRRNHAVIVQQAWLREAFERLYGPLPTIVAYPSVTVDRGPTGAVRPESPVTFLYPSFPRVHKNFELLCQAAELLEQRTAIGFEVRLTLSGNENAYSRWLHDKYKHVRSVRFIGLQSRADMAIEYAAAAVVVFPGKLETWGLPITEAKAHGKPLLVSDLAYGHETVGSYAEVSFFAPGHPDELMALMLSILEKRWKPSGSVERTPAQPFARGWPALWRMIAHDL